MEGGEGRGREGGRGEKERRREEKGGGYLSGEACFYKGSSLVLLGVYWPVNIFLFKVCHFDNKKYILKLYLLALLLLAYVLIYNLLNTFPV